MKGSTYIFIGLLRSLCLPAVEKSFLIQKNVIKQVKLVLSGFRFLVS